MSWTGKVLSLFKSRRFYTASVGLIVVVGTHFGLNLSETELLSIVTIVSSWIFGDSIRETK